MQINRRQNDRDRGFGVSSITGLSIITVFMAGGGREGAMAPLTISLVDIS